MLKKPEFTGLFNDSSNTTKHITNCVILNILYCFLLQKLSHFVTITFISKNYQVQNEPMDFYLKNKNERITIMKIVHAEYNPQTNSIAIYHYNGYLLRIDCNKAEEVSYPLLKLPYFFSTDRIFPIKGSTSDIVPV